MKNIALCLVTGFFAVSVNGSVVLENEAMSIAFSSSRSGFAVTSIVNRLDGETRFVDTDCRAPDFWEIRLVSDDGANSKKSVRLQNHTPSKERFVEHLDGGYAFIWKGMSIPNGEKECVDVRAEVRLPKGSASSEWTISVNNRSRKWALTETRCPVLRGVVKSGEADVLMPHKGFGARLHKAYDTRNGEVGEFGYPGWYPMVAAYMKNGSGLYLAAHDSDAVNKSVIFSKGAGISFLTPVENDGVPGKAAKGPRYPVVVSAFRGDWWTAAHIYRDWAVKQKWCAKGKIAVRKDYPRRISETDLFLRPQGDARAVSNLLAKARAALPDLNIIAHWYCWNIQPFDTDYPEYHPKESIPETFAWMNSIGIYAMPYINGRLWDQSLASAKSALDNACMRQDGAPQIEKYGRTFAVMCPAAKGWHEVLRQNFYRTVFDWNAGAVYCDQISCSRPRLCYNPAHGHTLGGGNWWAEGYRTVLNNVRDMLAPKGAPITSEGMAECWIDCMDGHLMCTDPLDGDVPFYPAVYSGYTTYFGARMQPYDNPEVFHAFQVRSLIWGAIPGWMHPWMFSGRNRSDAAIDSLLQTGRMRRVAREFLAYGTLEDELRPLRVLPQVKFSWKCRDKRYKKEPVYREFSGTMPAIVGTVWKNSQGSRLAVVAANVSAKTETVQFKIPDGAKTLATLKVEGIEKPDFTIADGVVFLKLLPRQIAFMFSP